MTSCCRGRMRQPGNNAIVAGTDEDAMNKLGDAAPHVLAQALCVTFRTPARRHDRTVAGERKCNVN